MGNKIKVVGYSKKEFFGNGIEYRPFTPDLVGLQLSSHGGTPLFTMGNFAITTNMEPKSDKNFVTTKFSNFVSLTDLNLTVTETQTLLSNNTGVYLNLDKKNLKNYALFGSLTEFVRVSLEDIITKWPASLYTTANSVDSNGNQITGYTIENYTYDSVTQEASFKINNSFVINKFQINYLKNGTILNTFNESNPLRDLTSGYLSYSILNNGVEYPLINFTGSTYQVNDYLYFKVKGNVFSGVTNSNISYHIKPNKTQQDTFFNALPEFEYYLLNRKVTPIYTSTYDYPILGSNGAILYISESITWPVSDGYNIDFDTSQYFNYITKLLDISKNNDMNSSDLINRFLVTESITAFDTAPIVIDQSQIDQTGQKVNKTLRIYGREFDDINKFISGIALANTVTYDKEDNTPDAYLKNIARVLGWELISSVIENDLLSNYVNSAESTYSGESVGLTPAEADIELWRRLILNTPWIWKSKGARKSVEFLLKFIGAPQGLVKFNEYIYKADAPIDVELFKQILALNGLDTDISIYPMDSDGYPRPLADTADMYFQNNGLWYRQTGGLNSDSDILTGNNPHLGPYDGGYKYINQFRKLITDFVPVTLSSETITTGTTNLYTNNQSGTFDQTSAYTTVNTVEIADEDLSSCYVVKATVLPDPYSGGTVLNNCGCPCEGTDNVLSVCVDKAPEIKKAPCSPNLISKPTVDAQDGLYYFSYYQYNMDGSIYKYNNNIVPLTTKYSTQECCKANNGTPFLYEEFEKSSDGTYITWNSGYICCDNSGKCGCTLACKWTTSTDTYTVTSNNNTTGQFGFDSSYSSVQYLIFNKQNGEKGVVTTDGCNCIDKYTIKVPNIVDPYTNKVGVGCQLTSLGLRDLSVPSSSTILSTYKARKDGVIGCSATYRTVVSMW